MVSKKIKYLANHQDTGPGIDLRTLQWEEVLEILKRQAAGERFYQMNIACGFEWKIQHMAECIK